MSTKLIKVKVNGHIIITKTFTPSKVQKKLINFLYKKIMNSKFIKLIKYISILLRALFIIYTKKSTR
jgi:hypothetical protein